MGHTLPRSALPRQSVTSTRCHHSREPFHALFATIAERRDISPAAKLLYAALVSVHRTQRQLTQAEIGETVGLSRHQVWRAQVELVAAGVLLVRRQGQGLPNTYELQGVNQSDLDGKAPRHAVAGHQEPRRPETTRSWSVTGKKTARMSDRDYPAGRLFDPARFGHYT